MIILSYYIKRTPVAHTGKNRNGIFKNYLKTNFRIVKTTNEIRQFFACENKYIIRSKRNPTVLHKVWDDVARHQEKNWKRQSKKSKQHGYNQVAIRNFFHSYDEDLLTEFEFI